jgi:hypothetical protein
MSKKICGVAALMGLCALSLALLNCGSSSSRPSGLLYVLTQGLNSNGLGNNVSSFSINLNSGALSLINSNASTCPTAATEQNPLPCGAPLQIVLNPTDSAAFVLNQGVPCLVQGTQCVPDSSTPIAPSIYPYTVNSDGSFSSPGTGVNWACISPNGTACTAYAPPCSVGCYYPDTATAMTLDSTGQFLFVIDEGQYPFPSSCPLPAAAAQTATDATNFIGCPSISVFSVSSTTLTFVSQSTTYQSPLFLSKTPSALSAITFTPPGSSNAEELLFVTDNYDLCTISCAVPSKPVDNALSIYAVSSTGTLSEQPNSPYAIAAPDPISVIAVNTNQVGENSGGVFAFVGNQAASAGSLNPFQLCTVQNSNCSQQDVTENLLVPVTCAPQTSCSVSAGSNPIEMVVDPTNSFLYSIAELSNQIFAFRINTTTGTLAALSPNPNLPTGSEPVSLAMHPTVNDTGQFLFVSNSDSDNLSVFSVSTITGAMSSPLTVIAPATPSGLAVH